ncbi:MAG: hypothetical protein A2817_01315 [Candidatus Yanofskybacteria bacterium RIFCSPHIGHO2_01_FULL_39_8b]|uniref:Uncharacterized protein n=1 Tax=Candidatus Yanofskybacteria bacterium RIFCSPHIGHO2_01_FULL_39_8b TaxID=1802659 RepID=A0A1F8EAN4_9BACT|nr:MAG: hypothetical protein A2817_01315 [Candidatus Yanofskybacteria bacterium RIFCSPHIGHO2_01_FULL_39_8b]
MVQKKAEKQRNPRKYLEIEISEEIYQTYQKVGKIYGISAENLMGCVISLRLENKAKTGNPKC